MDMNPLHGANMHWTMTFPTGMMMYWNVMVEEWSLCGEGWLQTTGTTSRILCNGSLAHKIMRGEVVLHPKRASGRACPAQRRHKRKYLSPTSHTSRVLCSMITSIVYMKIPATDVWSEQ
jgi:hypothetical protein